MTNREEIAKGAFEAMLSNPAVIAACLREGNDIDRCVLDIAGLSVQCADALIARLDGES